MQIFTLANPFHFGLRWFVTEEILAVFTVYEVAVLEITEKKLQNSPSSVYKSTENLKCT